MQTDTRRNQKIGAKQFLTLNEKRYKDYRRNGGRVNILFAEKNKRSRVRRNRIEHAHEIERVFARSTNLLRIKRNKKSERNDAIIIESNRSRKNARKYIRFFVDVVDLKDKRKLMLFRGNMRDSLVSAKHHFLYRIFDSIRVPDASFVDAFMYP